MEVYSTSMSTRHIATSTLWQIASQVIMAALSIVAAKFVAIGLSKELAGFYNSAFGYLQIFAILADFGLYAVSVREVSKAKEKEKILGTLLVLRFGITLLSLGSAILFAFIVPAWQGTPFPTGIAIAALVPFFTLLAGVLRAVFQIHYKMQFVFIAEVMQRALSTIGIGIFIWMGVRLSTDARVYEAFLWIGGAGAALLFLISFVYAELLMKIRPHFDPVLLKRMLLLAAPYGGAYLFISLYRQLDVAFISLLRPDFALQNAHYGFAGRVEDMAFLVPTFLLNSVLPILSKRLSDNEDVRDLLGKTFFILIVLGMIFLLFSYFWSVPLTLLFATRDYLTTPELAGTDRALELMSIPMFLNGIVLFCFYVALAKHAWRSLLVTLAGGVVLTVLLNVLWTPAYGFVGAAWALIVVHVILAAALVPQTLKISAITLRWSALGKCAVFSAILGLFLSVTAPLMTTAGTILGGLALVAVMIPFAAFATGLHRELLGHR